jgi:ubiquinone/menaquinone biosynthesis C-methylase UbiE/uncharacterized protein YbaR (Trm112 family)
MNLRLLDFLADPNDGGTLELHPFSGKGNQIRTGVLTNPQTGRWYPIRDGIPTLFGDALRAGTALREADAAFAARFKQQIEAAGCDLSHIGSTAAEEQGDFARMESERRARDAQAQNYDKMLGLKFYERIEIPAYQRAVGEAYDTPLLEAGCGTGRFTGVFAERAREVVAVDLSRDSILRNRVRHSGKTAAPVHYVHADLTHLPCKDDLFGRVAHCGVYEHIPSRTLRLQFLDHARRVLKTGGTLLLTAYRYGGITRLFEKEGEHDGGIPFVRFTENELKDETGQYFNVTHFQPNLGIYMSLLVGQPRKFTDWQFDTTI